jgi:uncharacterized PurR-regulated membrane protein YhhQ (DUF165 family)
VGQQVSARIAVAAALVGSVVLANAITARHGLIPAGFGLLVPAGTYAAGLALGLRDALDRLGGLPWVLAAIAVGVSVSAVAASPALAVASAVAFAASELVDLAVWRAMLRRGVTAAVVASNSAGALVDTVLFLTVSGLGLSAVAVGGQLLVKAGWLTLLALAVVAVVRATRSRAVTA